MEVALAAMIGVFFTTAIYLLLSRSLVRMLLGVVIFGNGMNLTLFTNGRLTREVPAFIPFGEYVPAAVTSNPLPQALVLTAIVIGFSIFAFLLILSYRAYEEIGTDNTNEMRVAEPEGEAPPPLSY